jgi:hypothetical protein
MAGFKLDDAGFKRCDSFRRMAIGLLFTNKEKQKEISSP